MTNFMLLFLMSLFLTISPRAFAAKCEKLVASELDKHNLENYQSLVSRKKTFSVDGQRLLAETGADDRAKLPCSEFPPCPQGHPGKDNYSRYRRLDLQAMSANTTNLLMGSGRQITHTAFVERNSENYMVQIRVFYSNDRIIGYETRRSGLGMLEPKEILILLDNGCDIESAIDLDENSFYVSDERGKSGKNTNINIFGVDSVRCEELHKFQLRCEKSDKKAKCHNMFFSEKNLCEMYQEQMSNRSNLSKKTSGQSKSVD